MMNKPPFDDNVFKSIDAMSKSVHALTKLNSFAEFKVPQAILKQFEWLDTFMEVNKTIKFNLPKPLFEVDFIKSLQDLDHLKKISFPIGVDPAIFEVFKELAESFKEDDAYLNATGPLEDDADLDSGGSVELSYGLYVVIEAVVAVMMKAGKKFTLKDFWKLFEALAFLYTLQADSGDVSFQVNIGNEQTTINNYYFSSNPSEGREGFIHPDVQRRIVKSDTRLFANPNSDGPVVCNLASGVEVTVISVLEKFTIVQYYDHHSQVMSSGYVKTSCIREFSVD